MRGVAQNGLNGREIAFISVMVAVLIGGQALFAAVPGVEIVTVLLLCFSRAFGPGRGVLTATAYSLLRCFFFGFDAKTIVLYLIYFNFFACLFGWSGRLSACGGCGERAKADGGSPRRKVLSVVAVDLLFAGLGAVAAAVLLCDLPISMLLRTGIKILAWVLLFLSAMGGVAYSALTALSVRHAACRTAAQAVGCAAAAAVCTVLFTLLDDALYPLFFGAGREGAIAYFYASFTAMLPQTVCVVISVLFLFVPLRGFFARAALRCRPRRLPPYRAREER